MVEVLVLTRHRILVRTEVRQTFRAEALKCFKGLPSICRPPKRVNLAEVCRRADILVAAIGKAKFITADMVQPGSVVLDVGINRVDGKLVGDVDFDAVEPIVSAISPVPGGVGLMTRVGLLMNTLHAARRP